MWRERASLSPVSTHSSLSLPTRPRSPAATTTAAARALDLHPSSGPTRGGTLISVLVPPHAPSTGSLVLAATTTSDGPVTLLNCTGASAAHGKHDEARCCCTPSAAGASTLKLRPHSGWPTHTRFEHFTYYEPPELLWLRPTSGRAGGGTAVTVSARGWPAVAPSAAPAAQKPGEEASAPRHGPRCRFGTASHGTVPATVLPSDARSKTVGRGKRPADETWLKCVTPAGAVGELPVLVAPNGVDFDQSGSSPPLIYRVDSPTGDSIWGPALAGNVWLNAGAVAAGVVVLVALCRMLLALRATLRTSGWADGTPTHWGGQRAGAGGAEATRLSRGGAEEEEEEEEGLVDGGGAGESCTDAADESDARFATPRTGSRHSRTCGAAGAVTAAAAAIDITTADKELADDIKRLLVLAETPLGGIAEEEEEDER